jgi:hypothetical protein
VIERFGKSFLDIIDLKQSFFEENEALLERANDQARLYLNQPLRTACKLCDGLLPETGSIVKSGIPYAVCDTCGHLNGLHEDTDEFAFEIYVARGGTEYAKNYTAQDRERYLQRRDAIYLPKVDFLFEVLRDLGVDPTLLRYADMGAGAGYLVDALRHRNAEKARGYEPGAALVAMGNEMIGDELIDQIDIRDVEGLAAAADVDVLSFIGVFEHLQRLRGTLAAVRENKGARFLYTCVPMFSATVFNEAVFPEVMPRHLTGGHTHLFTRSSLAHMEKEFSLERVGAWWFGTDVMDYYRSVAVSLPPESVAQWRDLYAPLVDNVQLVIDEARASSQVHLVYRLSGAA